MKTLKALKAVSAAAIASSIFMAPAYTVFAEESVEQPTVETANVSKMVLAYNANGGSAAPKAQSVQAEAIVTISANQPKRNGFVFMGWSEDPNADPNGGLLHGGETYLLSHNATLYAIWQPAEVKVVEETNEPAANEAESNEPAANEAAVSFQVMFDAHGGSMSYDHADSDENGNVVLPDEKPIKFGANFIGWATDPESGNVVYQPGDSITLDNDMKLYAVWETFAPTVTYQLMLDPHGGSMSIHSVTSDENGNVVLPDEKPVKDGFNFIGWAADPESGNVVHQPGDSFTIESDMKLYAVWQQVKPEVHVNLYFDANGGVGGPTSIATNADGTVTIPTLIPVKNGFKFMGWSTDAKATKAMYGVNQTLTLNSDLKLYAVWEADKKVNTGVENNMMMYLGLGGISALAASALAVLKRKNS